MLRCFAGKGYLPSGLSVGSCSPFRTRELPAGSKSIEKKARQTARQFCGPILWISNRATCSTDRRGRGHLPRGTFAFVKEDLKGTSPKLVVKDQDDVKWKVKLGVEARPETVACGSCGRGLLRE